MTDPAILILTSLADGDKHGYAIVQDIERFAEVRLGPGTLYGAITRLEEQGWIQPLEPVERRRPYRLTPAGRRYLAELCTGKAENALSELHTIAAEETTITLLSSAPDQERSHAAILRDLLQGLKKPPSTTGPVRAASGGQIRARRNR